LPGVDVGGGSLDDFREYPGFKGSFTSKAQSLLSHQLASQSQSLGDLIIKEILAVNPDRLLDAKRTNELTIFFFVLVC